MSMDLMVRVMKVKVGNPLRKLVLLKLADNANDHGECWPSVPHIAQQCEISERSVQNHLRELAASGFLWIEERKGKNGLNQSNMYHLTIGSGNKGTGENAAPYGANAAGSGANAAPSNGANAAPRISHSFEPVIEPVIEPKDIGAQAKASTPKKFSGQRYESDFERIWQVYPKRAGGNSKASAFKSWKARLREGVSSEEILAGVQRYAAYVAATGRTGTEYVKQAATFFGPDRHFEESWQVQAAQPRQATSQLKHSSFAERDYGATQTPPWAKEVK